MTWLDGNWCGMFRISAYDNEHTWDKLPKGSPGVYRLVALCNCSNFTPERLNRVCGLDVTGTLYIGRGGSRYSQPDTLANRISELAHTHSRRFRGASHRKLPKPLGDLFPDDKLAIEWELTDDPRGREGQILANYEGVFGELPPLNSQKSKALKALAKRVSESV
jgi:hypothetical protein